MIRYRFSPNCYYMIPMWDATASLHQLANTFAIELFQVLSVYGTLAAPLYNSLTHFNNSITPLSYIMMASFLYTNNQKFIAMTSIILFCATHSYWWLRCMQIVHINAIHIIMYTKKVNTHDANYPWNRVDIFC